MINVLFVCLGNICRSPSGEAVLKHFVKNAGLEDQFLIDSAGTSAYHAGEMADARMRKHAAKRNIELTSRSRQFCSSDFEKFDYILAMDYENYQNILRLDRDGRYENKIYMMNDFSALHKGTDVPDPYYGGSDGFERVLDMLEESCSLFLEKVIEEHELTASV